MDLNLLKENLNAINVKLTQSERSLNIPALKIKLAELKGRQDAPDFWDDAAEAQKVSREAKNIEDKTAECAALLNSAAALAALIGMAEDADDAGLISEIASEQKKLEKGAEAFYLKTLLSGKYDCNNAIISLHAGAGGTESQDWVSMLYRMYRRYAEDAGYKTVELDFLEGDGAGYKSVTFSVSGEYAYGYLKAEKGVHRLVRISPFDAAKRRHTSFASVEVMPEIAGDDDVEIDPADLKIDTYRSGGAGGQHVNKTESAVRITHIPTGLIAACQNERSQVQNKAQALNMLKSKLVEKRERETAENIQNIKGEIKKIEWGSQIRSYVFCPYTMVKDHRTNFENSDVAAVMDGDIQPFINDYLVKAGL